MHSMLPSGGVCDRRISPAKCMEPVSVEEPMPFKMVGYYRRTNDGTIYCVHTEIFRSQACKGFRHLQVLAALEDAGHHLPEPDRRDKLVQIRRGVRQRCRPDLSILHTLSAKLWSTKPWLLVKALRPATRGDLLPTFHVQALAADCSCSPSVLLGALPRSSRPVVCPCVFRVPPPAVPARRRLL